MTRRRFLKTGVIGGGLLVTAGWFSHGTFWGKGSKRAHHNGLAYHFLTESDREALLAITPVILGGALRLAGTGEAEAALREEVVHDFDKIISVMPSSVQTELRRLMTLLTLAPTRWTLVGVRASWKNASQTEIDGFLNRWRHSKRQLFRSAYDALTQLINGAWYGNPKAWSSIGYPGPPQFT